MTGYAALGAMVATVVFGILMASGLARHVARRQTLYGGHMTLAITALTLGTIHGISNAFGPQAFPWTHIFGLAEDL